MKSSLVQVRRSPTAANVVLISPTVEETAKSAAGGGGFSVETSSLPLKRWPSSIKNEIAFSKSAITPPSPTNVGSVSWRLVAPIAPNRSRKLTAVAVAAGAGSVLFACQSSPS